MSRQRNHKSVWDIRRIGANIILYFLFFPMPNIFLTEKGQWNGFRNEIFLWILWFSIVHACDLNNLRTIKYSHTYSNSIEYVKTMIRFVLISLKVILKHSCVWIIWNKNNNANEFILFSVRSIWSPILITIQILKQLSDLKEHLFIERTHKFNYDSILQTHLADDTSIYSMI